jgi:hypothetical protein
MIKFSIRFAATVLFTSAFFVHSTFAATTQTSDCQIIGDADIYGLGVRLSFYLQWVASLVQLFFCPEASATTRPAAVITVLAVFINTLCNLHGETLVAVEWSMLYSLLTCLLSWNIPITEAMWHGLDKTGGSYFVLFVILAVYQIMCPYIIFKAWDYGRQPGCSAKFIFWTAIDAYSKGWTIFLKVSWVIAPLVPGALYLGLAIYSLLKWSTSWGISAGLKKLLSKFEASFIEGEDDISDGAAVWFLRSFALGAGAIGIGFLEATIIKNNITFPDTHLTNSGQLMPLLIGIFTLVVTICDAVKACPKSLYRKDKQQIEDAETVGCTVQVDRQ